jgi:hypothetical protein
MPTRRRFLRLLGATSTLTISAAAFAACGGATPVPAATAPAAKVGATAAPTTAAPTTSAAVAAATTSMDSAIDKMLTPMWNNQITVNDFVTRLNPVIQALLDKAKVRRDLSGSYLPVGWKIPSV